MAQTAQRKKSIIKKVFELMKTNRTMLKINKNISKFINMVVTIVFVFERFTE